MEEVDQRNTNSSDKAHSSSTNAIVLETNNKMDTENGSITPVPVENGESSDVGEDGCSCRCCQKRLDLLEKEMKDLKCWKDGKQNIDDIMSKWKEEVESWMLSTFGFVISGSLSTVKPNDEQGCSTNLEESVSQNKTEAEATIEDRLEDLNMDLGLNGDTENVEITPDLFGHFLLDNEYDYGESDDDDIEEIDDESLGDEEEEPEVPVKASKRQKRGNDSESECYTLSTSSSESEDLSSDEYEPVRKGGRGRGRGRPPINKVLQNKNIPQSSTSSTQLSNSSAKNNALDLGSPENREELLKHCRQRQGNIWECTVCGFMLTSFDNMLLHIKYNHSSSTHTCPYCRIVVLCRSPKDAIMHQSECKMRPPANSISKPPEAKIIRPVQKEINTTTVPKSKSTPKDVQAEVDKFVEDLLDSGACSRRKNSVPKAAVKKNNCKKTEEAPVVTLSSDED